MDPKAQVDSPRKSPVSKNVPQTVSKDPEIKEAPLNVSFENNQNMDQTNPQAMNSDISKDKDELLHPIITVDIQKVKPSEDKKLVPLADNSEVETVASIVTAAVVSEAAATVSLTDELTQKPYTDGSKVDAIVQQELNKINENTAMSYESKVTSHSDTMPNGDLDCSPNSEQATTELSKAQDDELKKNELKATDDSDKSSKTENQETTSDSCNGIPGIITVVAVSKKEAVPSSKPDAIEHLSENPKALDENLNNDKKVSEVEAVQSNLKTDEDADNLLGGETQTSKKRHTFENLTDSAKLQNQVANSAPSDNGSQILNSVSLQDTGEKKDVSPEVNAVRKTSDASNDIEKQSDEISSNTELSNACKATEATNDDSVSETEAKNGVDNSACDTTAVTTSQIVTAEVLSSDHLSGAKEQIKKDDKKVAGGEKPQKETERGEIYDRKCLPMTRDIGVGFEGRPSSVRVASGDGGEEEVDGQQATTEVELDDRGIPEVEETTTPVHHDGACSPSSDHRSSPTVSSPVSKTSFEEECKPVSATSRSSSIPDAVSYEPPERRRSANSDSSDGKKDIAGIEKSQEDEKESEKGSIEEVKEPIADTEGEPISGECVPHDGGNDNKNDADSTEIDHQSVESLTAPELETEVIDDKEKGSEDEKETENGDLKIEEQTPCNQENEVGNSADLEKNSAEEPDQKVTEENSGEVKIGETGASEKEVSQIDNTETNIIEETNLDEPPPKEDPNMDGHSVETESKEFEEISLNENKELNIVEKSSNLAEGTQEENESVVNSNDTDTNTETKNNEKVDVEKQEKMEETEVEVIAKGLEEPRTLVEEENGKSEKEAFGIQEEKEEDDTEKEVTPDEEKEDAKMTQDQKEEVGDVSGEVKLEEEKEKEEENQEKKEILKDGSEKHKVDFVENETEKKDSEKQEEAERRVKSPTKRTKSPDKATRRGISPLSSPPKPIKTPPSPQKPPKTTSPKKKNGSLSPIKTPKTPGTDTRKLPPIKAPVGLAPNPNLKNIRSKIGSFDNIRYKPGGGDKKVISTKKLEWKAAPKIGSLDHCYRSNDKKRSHSKGEPKEAKLAEGQSPLPSGDEGDHDQAAGKEEPETLQIDATTELPAPIAAES